MARYHDTYIVPNTMISYSARHHTRYVVPDIAPDTRCDTRNRLPDIITDIAPSFRIYDSRSCFRVIEKSGKHTIQYPKANTLSNSHYTIQQTPHYPINVTCARRALKTKSRGSKGLQLEVRARRASRLLFSNILLAFVD